MGDRRIEFDLRTVCPAFANGAPVEMLSSRGNRRAAVPGYERQIYLEQEGENSFEDNLPCPTGGSMVDVELPDLYLEDPDAPRLTLNVSCRGCQYLRAGFTAKRTLKIRT